MAQITVRCSDEDLARFKEEAYRARMSLNSWVLARLNGVTEVAQLADAEALRAKRWGGPGVTRELKVERDE